MADSQRLVCFEIYCDPGLDFDRVAVEVIGLISPLAHGIQRSTRESGISADCCQIGHKALFVDGGVDLYCALGMGG